MRKEFANEFWPLIKAYGEGKTIQIFDSGVWENVENPEFDGGPADQYRVKPEPEYEPFTLELYYPHFHVGETLLLKHGRRAYEVVLIGNNSLEIKDMEHLTCYRYTYAQAFEHFTFKNGKPFGYEKH